MPKFVRRRSRYSRPPTTTYVNWYWLICLAVFFLCYMLIVPMEMDISAALIRLHKAEELLAEAVSKQKMTMCDARRTKDSRSAGAFRWIDENREKLELWINNCYDYTLYISVTLISGFVTHSIYVICTKIRNYCVYNSFKGLLKYVTNNIIAHFMRIYSIIFFDFDVINQKIKTAEQEKIKFAAQRRKWEKERKETKNKQICSLKKTCDILCKFSVTKKEVSEMHSLLDEMRFERREVLERLRTTQLELNVIKSMNEDTVKELQITVGLNVMLKAKVFALQNEKEALEERLNNLDRELWCLKSKPSHTDRSAWDRWRTRSRFMVEEIGLRECRRLGKTGSQTAEVGSDSNFSLNQNQSCTTNKMEAQRMRDTTSQCSNAGYAHPGEDAESTTTSVNCESQSASSWSDDTAGDVGIAAESESVRHCPQICQASNCSLCAEFHYNRGPDHYTKNFECYEYISAPYVDVYEENQYSEPACLSRDLEPTPSSSNYVCSEFRSTTRRSHKRARYEYDDPSYSTSLYDSNECERASEYECCEYGHRLRAHSVNTSDLVQVTEFNYSHKTMTSEEVTADEMEPNVLLDEQINLKKYLAAAKRDVRGENWALLRQLLKGNRDKSPEDTCETRSEISECSEQGSLRPVTDSPAFRHFLRGLDRAVYSLRTSDSSLMSASARRCLSRPASSTTRSLSPLSGRNPRRHRLLRHRPRTAAAPERVQQSWYDDAPVDA